MKFTPTAEQIRMAEAVFTAMANESMVRPVVEAYETEILAKHQFKIDQVWVERGYESRVIVDRKDVCLLSAKDSPVYFAECFVARDAAKLAVDDPTFCPLCVAENLRVQAEVELLKAMSKTPGLTSLGNISAMTMEQHAKAIDLVLRLLAPYVGSANSILDRYLGATSATQ